MLTHMKVSRRSSKPVYTYKPSTIFCGQAWDNHHIWSYLLQDTEPRGKREETGCGVGVGYRYTDHTIMLALYEKGSKNQPWGLRSPRNSNSTERLVLQL